MDPNGPETRGKVGMFQAHATTVQGIRQPRRPSDSSQFPGYISELKPARYSMHKSVPPASRVRTGTSQAAHHEPASLARLASADMTRPTAYAVRGSTSVTSS